MKHARSILVTTRHATVVLCTMLVLLAAVSAQAQTPISGCTTINRPGNYVVTAPFNCAVDAIVITANKVTLHLGGWTIGANVNAVHAISVKNLAIVGPGTAYTADQGCGVRLDGVSHSQVIGVTATQNAIGICLFKDVSGFTSNHNRVVANKANVNTTGIQSDVSQSNVYLGNECSNNGGGMNIQSGQGDLIEGNRCNINTTGIQFIGTAETAVGNEADGNINVGIFVQGGTGNSLSNNEATGNGVDLDDNNGVCTLNTWKLDAFLTSNPGCLQ